MTTAYAADGVDSAGGAIYQAGWRRQPSATPVLLTVEIETDSASPVMAAYDWNRLALEILRPEFDARVADWSAATAHLSSPARIYSHPTYQRLMMLGREIVPLILEDIRHGAAVDWYEALRAFANDFDPVTDAERGHVALMDAAWLRWGRDNGFID